MYNDKLTKKLAETAKRIIAGESVEESMNESRDTDLTHGFGVRIRNTMDEVIKDLNLAVKGYPKWKKYFSSLLKKMENLQFEYENTVEDLVGEPIQEAVNEATGDKEAYQKFFNDTLKKYGVKSPAELKGDDEKKFYDEIDAGWKGDDEKPEKNESVELEDDEDEDVEEGLVGNLIKKGAKRFLTRKGRNDARAKKLKKLKNKEAEIRRSKQLKRDIKNAKKDVKKARASKRVRKTRKESVELEEGKIDLKKKVKNEKEFESYMDSFKGPDILAAVEKLDSGEKHQKGTVGFFLSQQMSMKEGTLKLDARRREFREKIKKLAYAKAKKMIQDEEGEEEEEEEEKDTE